MRPSRPRRYTSYARRDFSRRTRLSPSRAIAPHFSIGPRRCLLCSACTFSPKPSLQLDTEGIDVTSSTCTVSEGESAETKVGEAWGPARTIV